MLTVYVYQVLAQLLQECQLNRSVVDKGTALATGVNLAPQDTLAPVVIYIIIGKEGAERTVLQVKLSLDDTLGLAALYLLDIGPVAQEQAQGSQDNTLARARLASYHREARKEVYIQLVYQRIILYIQMS